MAYDGDIRPFLTLLHRQVLSRLSNRDLIRLDEKSMKLLMLAYLSLTDVFYPFSEFELNRGYGDLILTLNRRYADASYSFLIELKYVKEATRTRSRKETPSKARGGARAKRPSVAAEVEARLAEAEEQLRRYLSDLRLDAVKGPRGWKAVSVVFVGTAAVYCRELGGKTQAV